jgi:hypothetical protein
MYNFQSKGREYVSSPLPSHISTGITTECIMVPGMYQILLRETFHELFHCRSSCAGATPIAQHADSVGLVTIEYVLDVTAPRAPVKEPERLSKALHSFGCTSEAGFVLW